MLLLTPRLTPVPIIPRRISHPRHQTRSSNALPPHASFRINHTTGSTGRLDEFRVFFTKTGEGGFGIPVPPGVGSEEEIHFFEGALVGFRVEGPDDGDGEEVDGAEDVEDFFVDAFEHCGEKEDLWFGLVG